MFLMSSLFLREVLCHHRHQRAVQRKCASIGQIMFAVIPGKKISNLQVALGVAMALAMDVYAAATQPMLPLIIRLLLEMIT